MLFEAGVQLPLGFTHIGGVTVIASNLVHHTGLIKPVQFVFGVMVLKGLMWVVTPAFLMFLAMASVTGPTKGRRTLPFGLVSVVVGVFLSVGTRSAVARFHACLV